jgi:MYXO-CTERM domain-containing protein
LTSLALLGAPGTARANGRFPAANQVVVSKTTPSSMVLRTTFGILLSSDSGTTWDWICEKSVGYGGTEDPSMGLTATGTVLAGTFEGLATSLDKGCSWAFVPGKLTQNVVVDLVVRPDAPATSLVMTNKFAKADDAGDALFQSDIFVATDDGKTWNPLGPSLDPTILFETIEVAASDPTRVYVSGVRGDGATEQGVVLVSKDTGLTWKEYAVPLDISTERAPFISAVDPKNPDRVYTRTKGSAGSRLLVSDDGAQSWREVLKFTSDMLGFAISDDGQKVWAGGPKDGLYQASAAALTFTQTSQIAIQCLTASGANLYACSNEVGGFILGASKDDGATFAPLLHLYGIRGPLACGAQTSQANCVPDWPALSDSLGTPPSDGGTDGSADGGTSSGSSGKGCSCDATPGSGDGALALGALGIAAALFAASRRKK